MRILRIATSIEPEVGGPANSAVNAAIAERRAGLSTTLISTIERSTQDPVALARSRLEAAGVECHTFRRLSFAREHARRWGLSLTYAYWILRNARRYDVLHVHSVWALGPVLGVLVAAATGRPVVMTAHESLTQFDIETSRSRWRRSQKLLVRNLLLRGVDCVIAASPLELRDSLADPRAGVVIAHPVIDAAPTRRPAQQSCGDPFAIGFLGRLHPKKNVSHLLHALAALPGNSRLIICGAGRPEYERELVQIAAAAGVTDRVVWRGFADLEEKRRLFAEVNVIAMPSAYESFGMVAAEAMAAGVPVIVSRSTGIAPIVELYGAGTVVSSDEPTEFASALMSFMHEPERLARAERGALEAARTALCFDGYARAVSGIYDQVAAGRQR